MLPRAINIILIPIYNDWESLIKLLDEINKTVENKKDYEFKCIVVNDSSTINQPKLSKPFNIKSLKIINMKENRGHARCNAFGLKYIDKNEIYDYLILMDGDGEDRPEEIKSLLDKILTDERWDLKLIGMQIIIEGLALAAFNTAKAVTPDPVLRDILHLIIRVEARHVTFGVNYLEDFIENLTDEEREDRAMFAYEACVISKERLFPTDVFRKFGWDEAEARDFSNKAGFATEFQRLLFSRVVPNLSRIGLLTDKVRPLYEELGVLEFESHTSDDISWAELEKPLDLTA